MPAEQGPRRGASCVRQDGTACSSGLATRSTRPPCGRRRLHRLTQEARKGPTAGNTVARSTAARAAIPAQARVHDRSGATSRCNAARSIYSTSVAALVRTFTRQEARREAGFSSTRQPLCTEAASWRPFIQEDNLFDTSRLARLLRHEPLSCPIDRSIVPDMPSHILKWRIMPLVLKSIYTCLYSMFCLSRATASSRACSIVLMSTPFSSSN